MQERAGTTIRHYAALDSLRGLCACMVALNHFSTAGWISGAPVVQHAYLFVDFFFVLSGLVIGASYADRIAAGFPVKRFMLLRLGRTAPLHVAMMLLFLAWHVLSAAGGIRDGGRGAFDPPDDLANFLINLCLVQIFVGPPGIWWNGPSWSIAAETWTYLLFAGLFRLAGRRLAPAAAAVALAAGLHLFLTRGDIAAVHDGAFSRALLGFGIGVVGARIAARLPAPGTGRRRLATAAELAVVAAVIAFVAGTAHQWWSLLAPLLFLAAVLVFALEAGAVSRLLRMRPFVALGTLSYSIYMVHVFTQERIRSALKVAARLVGHPLTTTGGPEGGGVGGGALFGDAMSMVMLALVVGFAMLTYRWIEKPARDWSRRAVAGRQPGRTVAAAEAGVPTF